MVKLETKSATIRELYKHYEDNAPDWRRNHLGASLIGHPCSRYLWFAFRWAFPIEFEGRIHRLFDTGKREELRILDEFKNLGMTVYEVDPKTGNQFFFSDFGGHFGGSPDAIVQGVKEAPKAWHVCEIKTMNKNQFDKLEKSCLQIARPQHYFQIQQYMAWTNLDRGFYVVVCKDDDRIYAERVYVDPQLSGILFERARRIIFDKEIPDPQGLEECRFCNAYKVCKGGKCVKGCRMCQYGKPTVDGLWWCHFTSPGEELSEEKQRAGCKEHVSRCG